MKPAEATQEGDPTGSGHLMLRTETKKKNSIQINSIQFYILYSAKCTKFLYMNKMYVNQTVCMVWCIPEYAWKQADGECFLTAPHLRKHHFPQNPDVSSPARITSIKWRRTTCWSGKSVWPAFLTPSNYSSILCIPLSMHSKLLWDLQSSSCTDLTWEQARVCDLCLMHF